MADRKRKIKQSLAAGKTYVTVAKDFGISRQRVQQIISPRSEALGIGVCSLCGREAVLHRHHGNYMSSKYQSLCPSCHQRAHKKATGDCPACGKATYRNHKYCSNECYQKARRVELVKLTCAVCGKEFRRYKSEVEARGKYKGRWANRTNNYFCSKRCQGFYTGKHYGFAKHPELIGKSVL